jgi:Tfp pilus assembly protein PilN
MRAVNLLPADAYTGTHWWGGIERGGEDATRRILYLFGTAGAAAALLLVGLYLDATRVVSDRQDTLSGLQVRETATQARAARAQAVGSVRRAHLGAIATVASQRMVWGNVLDDLSRIPQVSSGKVRLSSLQAQGPTAAAPVPGAAPAPAGNTFSITGSANSHRTVAALLDSLASLPWLTDVKLQSSTHGGSETGPASIQFAIQAAVQSTGAR